MQSPTLIVLAAGRSRRFGRPKQLEPVTEQGETLLDITLRDAFRHGCAKGRIVVRPEHETHFQERFRDEARITILVQPQALGTGDATAIGLRELPSTAIVVNGDDHYGTAALPAAIHHAMQGTASEHALITFELARTLSPSGPVNRATCRIVADLLAGLDERTGLTAAADSTINDDDGNRWAADTPVSMNLWVLRKEIGAYLNEMIVRGRAHPNAEFGLPDMAKAAIAGGERFRCIHTTSDWCGLTHEEDLPHVRRVLSSHP